MTRNALVIGLMVLAAVPVGARELTWVYVVPAAANTRGDGGTDWHTDLTLHNPQDHTLPILVQFLPSSRNNEGGVPSVTVDVGPWETLNLWDVLGPDGFDVRGTTGALFVYPDLDPTECGGTDCDFAVFSRTYTLDPGGNGEFGQAIPGFPAQLGLDWSVLAYLPQVMNTPAFRTNVGVASWTATAITVRVDVQDEEGNILDRTDHYLPPFGHVQWRMSEAVEGGTVVAYLVQGPNDAVAYPYASVVNWATGDPAYVEAQHSGVGFTAQASSSPPSLPRPPRLPATGFSVERLRIRAR